MCETRNRDALRNGHKGDLGTIGLATADIIDALIGVQSQLKDIPTRSEVREMVQASLNIHVESCEHAAKSLGAAAHAESNKFKVGLAKFGLEAEGRAGVLFGALIGIGLAWLVYSVAPHIIGWIAALYPHGGTP